MLRFQTPQLFTNAITLLEKEQEPTMLVIPDAVEVFDAAVTDTNADDYYEQRYKNAYSLQMAMINHCGNMMDRVAILDVPGGYIPPGVSTTSVQTISEAVWNHQIQNLIAMRLPIIHG